MVHQERDRKKEEGETMSLPEGIKVVLLSHTDDMMATIGAAARSCYSPDTASEIIDDIEKSEKVIASCVKRGHDSVIEHASFTFSVEGVSRAMTHQLVRHRIASFSQQSQRYVSFEEVYKEMQNIQNNANDVQEMEKIIKKHFVIPPEVKANTEAYILFFDRLRQCIGDYNALRHMGIKKEDARFLIPNAARSNIVVTMNLRGLRNFFKLRTDSHAQWEIRAVANEILKICKENVKIIFDDFEVKEEF